MGRRSVPGSTGTLTHCPYCALNCGVELRSEGREVVGQARWKGSPFSRGAVCTKGATAWKQISHPDRLRHPLVRDTREGPLREASWEEALDRAAASFLRVRDATLIDLGSRDRIQTPLVHVNIDEILMAHEFLDSTTDPMIAQMASERPQKLNRVRVFYTGNLNVEVAGNVRPGSYEIDDQNTKKFFVMTQPEVRGMNLEGDRDLENLAKMDWAILNKTRLSYVYDFSG